MYNDLRRCAIQYISSIVEGPILIVHLKWFEGEFKATFKDACIARGLAMNDDEWEHALTEAASYQMPRQLYDMFIFIVVWNSPTNPIELFENHWDEFIDHTVEPYRTLFPSHATRRGVDLRVIQRAQLILDMRVALEEAGLDEDQASSRLPSVTQGEQQMLTDVQHFEQAPRLLRAERDYVGSRERRIFQEMSEKIALQPSQHEALAEIQDRYLTGGGGAFFLDAPAGSGKTFVEQALLHMVRADGEIAVAVSSTGITALLLEGGGTLHSRWKAQCLLCMLMLYYK